MDRFLEWCALVLVVLGAVAVLSVAFAVGSLGIYTAAQAGGMVANLFWG